MRVNSPRSATTNRKQLSEVLVEQNDGRVPVVIGVSGVAAEVAAGFARHARDIAADAVIAMPPYVRNGRLSETVIFDYYLTIGRRRPAPGVYPELRTAHWSGYASGICPQTLPRYRTHCLY